jgi:hypothetical protein
MVTKGMIALPPSTSGKAKPCALLPVIEYSTSMMRLPR